MARTRFRLEFTSPRIPSHAASGRNTGARIAIPPNCSGPIDLRTFPSSGEGDLRSQVHRLHEHTPRDAVNLCSGLVVTVTLTLDQTSRRCISSGTQYPRKNPWAFPRSRVTTRGHSHRSSRTAFAIRRAKSRCRPTTTPLQGHSVGNKWAARVSFPPAANSFRL